MLMINSVWAQMSMRPSPKDMKPQKNLSFDKFYERLKVGYFGVFSSPNFREMKKETGITLPLHQKELEEQITILGQLICGTK